MGGQWLNQRATKNRLKDTATAGIKDMEIKDKNFIISILQLELTAINETLSNMKDWFYLNEQDRAMRHNLENRKEMLEFLIENT